MPTTLTEVRWRWPEGNERLAKRELLEASGVEFCDTCLGDTLTDDSQWIWLIVQEGEPPDLFCSWRCLALFAAGCTDVEEESIAPLRVGTSIKQVELDDD